MLAISLKKVSKKHSANKKKKIITVELKKKISGNHERGMRVVDLASQKDRSISMICTFSVLKFHNKDFWVFFWGWNGLFIFQ